MLLVYIGGKLRGIMFFANVKYRHFLNQTRKLHNGFTHNSWGC